MFVGTGSEMGEAMWRAFEGVMQQRYGAGVNLGSMSATDAREYATESARLAWRAMGARLEEWLVEHVRVSIGDPDVANIIPLADETPQIASSATHSHSLVIENNKLK